MEKNFCEKSTYCSFLSTHKEDITFYLKCVMEESFYVKNNTYRGFNREKFPPDGDNHNTAKILEQNESQIVLIKTFEFTSFVMGYHVYRFLDTGAG